MHEETLVSVTWHTQISNPRAELAFLREKLQMKVCCDSNRSKIMKQTRQNHRLWLHIQAVWLQGSKLRAPTHSLRLHMCCDAQAALSVKILLHWYHWSAAPKKGWGYGGGPAFHDNKHGTVSHMEMFGSACRIWRTINNRSSLGWSGRRSNGTSPRKSKVQISSEPPAK